MKESASLLHPATRIGVWILLALAVAWLRWEALAFLSAVLATWLAATRNPTLMPMVRRARWLLASLLLVYGFATPGTPLWEAVPALSREGIALGGMQAWRIVLMLAGLSLLTAATPSAELVSGIRALLRPLATLGLDPGRFALRLALTLEYARQQAPVGGRNWRDALAAALEPEPGPAVPVIVQTRPFTWRDSLVLGALALALALGLA
ncbi:MAG TPA: energy-coupling factor transporter transmembrane component T [Burkholderiales bacterium]|nr:energy-coupling factor transporter transmembrane component T [Burkholderiales bacterium]